MAASSAHASRCRCRTTPRSCPPAMMGSSVTTQPLSMVVVASRDGLLSFFWRLFRKRRDDGPSRRRAIPRQRAHLAPATATPSIALPRSYTPSVVSAMIVAPGRPPPRCVMLDSATIPARAPACTKLVIALLLLIGGLTADSTLPSSFGNSLVRAWRTGCVSGRVVQRHPAAHAAGSPGPCSMGSFGNFVGPAAHLRESPDGSLAAPRRSSFGNFDGAPRRRATNDDFVRQFLPVPPPDTS